MHEILTYLPQILPAYVAYLIAVISPGPAIMAIVSTSMTHGRKAGMTIALGIFAGFGRRVAEPTPEVVG